MPANKSTNQPKRERPTLEQQYQEMMRRRWQPTVPLQTDYGDSLEQPSPLRVVTSVTTYSAYEDPV